MENQFKTVNGNLEYFIYFENVLVYVTAARSPGEAIDFACTGRPDICNYETRPRLGAVIVTDQLRQKEKGRFTKSGSILIPFLLFVDGKVKGYNQAVSAAQAKEFFCHHHRGLNKDLVGAEVATEKLYKRYRRRLKKSQERESQVEIDWQPTLFGKKFGNHPTRAKTQARAGCNRWYTEMKSKEDPTSEPTKRTYHEGVSAFPIFGQSSKNRRPANRKVSHSDNLSLIPNHHQEC